MPGQHEEENARADEGSPASIGGAPPPMETDDSADVMFRSMVSFYEEYFAVLVQRRVDGVHLAWCPDWWKHGEAVARLNLLWRAFEYLRHDAVLGLSNWWLHHVDPHLAVLMDPRTGPFALCSGPEGHSTELGPLPGNPVPEGLFDLPAFSVDVAEAESAAEESDAEDPDD